MGSLFFVGERVGKAAAVEVPVDLEVAAEAVATKEIMQRVACLSGLQPDTAARFIALCRDIDQQLMAAIQARRVVTKAEAVSFVAELTAPGEPDEHGKVIVKPTDWPGFPSSKFVDILCRLGIKDGSVAPWADVVAAAKDEIPAVK